MSAEEFRPPFWLRIASNAPLIAAAAILLSGGIREGAGGTLAFGIAATALMVGFVVRSMMLKIVAGENGVTVVNWRSTQRYPWSDVLFFEYDRAGLWLTRRSKERVAVKAFSFGRALKPVQRQGKAVAEQLETIRKAHKAPPASQQRQRKKKR
jgi:hypothetical protein